jgi:hypothetical protein
MDFSKSVQEAIDSSIRNWLESHWPLGWIIANPWLSLLLLLVLIVVFWGLLGALGRSVQQGWLWALQIPIKLSTQIKANIIPGRNRLPSREQRIEAIVQQIAVTQEEQAQLLNELTNLIAQRKN